LKRYCSVFLCVYSSCN